MAGLLDRIKGFLRGPQGKALTEKARGIAADPRNRERARTAVSRLRRKR
ncbi:hypothetical protein [Actinokineospora iranica]|uniref:MT0933-like antitoxin protein n=1 Tax=Actinokineospora iranica TaxID=1271860 RepID=A0A1G6IZD4_9PSEU|nr:hypothetical protein [Actinokineospora iranica]SDC11781.1 hypothetical protein SAMN05216174_101163 [Actinokineospora iranica]